MRGVGSVVLCASLIGVAALSAGQATSNVLAKTDPALVAAFLPVAPQANNELAEIAMITSGLGDPAKFARSAFEIDPLSGRAIAVLGTGIDDPAVRSRFFDVASRIGRRGTLLQGTLLKEYIAQGDTPNTLKTLDHVLTVYPELTSAVMPSLIVPLSEAGAQPIYVEILSGSPGWQDEFLILASASSELLPKITAIRLALGNDASISTKADVALMRALARAGNYNDAYTLYANVSGQARQDKHQLGENIELDWRTEFAPFDWVFTDDPNEYARLIENSKKTEVLVRRGNGGILARRSIVLSRPISAITITHDIKTPGRSNGMEVQLACAPTGEVILKERVSVSPSRHNVSQSRPRCSTYEFTISGRAWSNEGDLSGTLESIVLTTG